MRVLLAVSLAATLLIGCGGAAATPTPFTASSACTFAFNVAARGDQVIEAVEDLNASIGTCKTAEEWVAAYDAFGGGGLGRPASEVLQELCAIAANTTKPLCVEAAP